MVKGWREHLCTPHAAFIYKNMFIYFSVETYFHNLQFSNPNTLLLQSIYQPYASS